MLIIAATLILGIGFSSGKLFPIEEKYPLLVKFFGRMLEFLVILNCI